MSYLYALQMLPVDMPEAVKPYSAQLGFDELAAA